MTPITCCQRNGHAEHGCIEGRLCPEGRCDLRALLTRRVSPEQLTVGYEGADAARVTGTLIVTDELREVREPIDWHAVVVWASVAACITAIAWLSIADPRDLSSFWPRLNALLSF